MLSTIPTQERQAQALAAAEACRHLLQVRFGVRRVILFGSLKTSETWHEQSDIDLAVEGLAPADFTRAYAACYDVLPRGLELDLVPLEKAYPELRARILEEGTMPTQGLLPMQALVFDELLALKRISQELEELLAAQAQPPTRTELRAIGSILHEFYNGVERIFERITLGLGEALPRGGAWHTALLSQVATARTETRPAIIDTMLHTCLQDYLGFRHFYRHAYGYTLDWHEMRWKAENLSNTLELLRAQLQRFFAVQLGKTGAAP